jgi:hypothetical protein
MNNPEIFLPNTFVAHFVGKDRSQQHENANTRIHSRQGGQYRVTETPIPEATETPKTGPAPFCHSPWLAIARY